MNLLDLAVKIIADDQATKQIGRIASNITNKIGKAAKFAAKSMAAIGTAAIGGAVAIGGAALEAYGTYEQLAGGVDKLFGNGGQTFDEFASTAADSMYEMYQSGEDILALQEELIAKGYDVGKAGADGIYGPDTKAAFEAYARDGGQLVINAWAQSSEAARIVKKNAQDAYKTVGMDANTYMQNVTGFSAALVNALGGDSVAAANTAELAMEDIADNANTFGVYTAEELANVYQNLAKGQFNTLDNLNLGYGGSQEGMQALLDKAEELSGVHYDIGNFADIVQAIHVVQEDMGITGTTANEAATTIEGSLTMTKAAWQNFLIELGKTEDADLGARATELVTSAATMMTGAVDSEGNKLSGGVIGKLTDIFVNLADALPGVMPMLTDAIGTALPQIIGAITTALPSLLQAIVDVAVALAAELPGIIGQFVPVLLSMVPTIAQSAFDMFSGLMQGLTELAPELVTSLSETLTALITVMALNLPDFLSAMTDLMVTLVTAITQNADPIVSALVDAIGLLLGAVIDNIPAMLAAAGSLFVAIVTALTNKREEVMASFGEMIGQFFSSLLDGIAGMASAGASFFGGLIDGVNQKVPEIVSFFTSLPGVVLTLLGSLGETLLQTGKDLLGGLLSGITAIFGGDGDETVEGFVKSIPGKITGFLESLNPLELLVNVGSNIMQGLVDGITNFNLRDAIVGVFGDVGAIACDALGIQSPSKVFREIGGYTMEGMAVGIEDAADQAIAATRDAVGGVYDAASRNVDVSMSTSQDNNMLALLAQIRDNMNMSVYLDGQTLVGGIAPNMNYALGVM